MKNLLILLLTSSITVLSFGQDTANDALAYSKVIQVDSATSADLYGRARSWFADTYNNAKEVIQLDDKENGKIIGKGSIQYSNSTFSGNTTGYVKYTLTIEVKDGRYKYSFTDYLHEAIPRQEQSFGLLTNSVNCPYKLPWAGKGWKNKTWIDMKETVSTKTKSIITSLETAMSANNKKSNW